jgi:HEAT repeat protein
MKYLVYIMLLFISMNTWAKESIRIDEPLLGHQDRQLLAKLHDKELSKRINAAKSLAERQTIQATDDLIEMLKADDEHQARITAGLALIEIATPRAIKAVKEQSVQDVNKTVRHALAGMINMLQKDL